MTLVEITVSAMLVTLLVTLMVPAALRLIDEARVNNAASQLEEIQRQVDAFHKANSLYPISLMEIYESIPVDPWGNPYQYLNLADGLKKTKGRARKYKGETFINTDYDLYSMGPDGKSVPPLSAEPSRDDIIRARDGDFIGVARNYE